MRLLQFYCNKNNLDMLAENEASNDDLQSESELTVRDNKDGHVEMVKDEKL